MSDALNILLTNDDGFDADGLRTLRGVAEQFGRVFVAAPDAQHSMKSHAISGGVDLNCRDIGPHSWACSGTPADCVRLGLTFLIDEPVHLVMSGINHGANLGVDLFYSGTIAAAREAALLGVPAIAVSQLNRLEEPIDWKRAHHWLTRALHQLQAHTRGGESANGRLDPSTLPPMTNINLPSPVDGELRGIGFRPLTMEPMQTTFEAHGAANDPRGVARYSGRYFDRPAPEGSDVHAVFNGCINITPLHVDGRAWSPD